MIEYGMSSDELPLNQQVGEARKTGASDENIRQALINAGHDPADVDLALRGQWHQRRINFGDLSVVHKALLILLLCLFMTLVIIDAHYLLSGDVAFLNVTHAFEIK